jgi:aryl-alcohol dehydrogenase-like predicted oxidoreductase
MSFKVYDVGCATCVSEDEGVPVEYRQVGDTELRVSEIGFGCGGNAGLMVLGSPEEQRQVVARAVELGINYFDNAPDYGNGLAEENLGRVLKELTIRPFITSKVEVRHTDLGDIAGHVVRSTEESLQRLGVDYLDVLQIHNGPALSPPKLEGRSYTQLWINDYLQPGGALEGLRRVVHDGKARYVGFICRGNDGDQVRQLIDTNLFRMINVPYTLLNPTAGMAKPTGLDAEWDFDAVISYAHEHGVGTAIYSPLAGGILTDQMVSGGDRHPLAGPCDAASEAYGRTLAMAQALSFLSWEGTHTLTQAAIRFILMHQGVTVVLGGFSAMDHLEEIAPVAGSDPLAPELMAQVETVWRTDFGFSGPPPPARSG